MSLNYKEALRGILNNTQRLDSERVCVEETVGYLSAEDVFSKIDMPPFDKSAMDGYAVTAQDTQDAPVRLRCVGLIQAGEDFKGKILHGECVKIMTGAALPKGVDSVVMIEDTVDSDGFVNIKFPASKRQNICFKGEDVQKGKKVLEKNRVISASCVALLAAVGRRLVKVVKRPKVAVLNTGGEIAHPSRKLSRGQIYNSNGPQLAAPGRKLSRGQIYNSNGPQLAALLKSDGIKPLYLGIVKDRPKELMRAVRKGFKSDIFLISGGVSMGDYDLVPGTLKRMGTKEIFHKVNIKPGKPLFFGKKARTLIFGIPGNPVSNFLTYQIFIRPAVYKMSGYSSYFPRFEKGILRSSFRQKAGRTHFVLVNIEKKDSNWHVNPVSCHGSADVLALSKANGFMVVDKGINYIKPGSEVKVFLWKEGLIT